MHQTVSARATIRTIGRRVVVAVVVIAAMVGILVGRTASSSARSPLVANPPAAPGVMPPRASSSAPAFGEIPRGDGRATTGDDSGITEADGALPDGVTV